MEIKRAILFPKTARPSSEILAAIEVTNMCEALGVLPYEGGLLDQEATTVMKMQMVLVAKNEKHEKEMEDTKKHGSRHKRT